MVIFDQGNVAVAPTLTVLTPPISVEQGQAAARVEIINNDVAQTLDVHFDKGETSIGPWSTSGYSELEAIQPGETRIVVIDVRFLRYIRIIGTSSGLGLSARVKAAVYSAAGDSSW
jgi:trans-2-enoyl-CoA reductase